MKKESVQPQGMATPAGPYSHGVKVGELLFVAGQVALDGTGQVVGKGDIGAQARQVMENIKSILVAGGSSLDDVTKITLFVTDMAYLPSVLEVRKQYFRAPFPASTAVEVSALANPDFMVEIEAIAVVGAGGG